MQNLLTILTKHPQFFENSSKKHVNFTEKLTNKLSFANFEKVSHGVFTEFVYKFYGAIVKLRGRDSSSGVHQDVRLSKIVLEAKRL